ncbi:MAG TPA: sialidase family protein [Solirubrobacteraceae bacterium]|nr:sialidase family protein [Solirubrobacteraceae bacterium]
MALLLSASASRRASIRLAGTNATVNPSAHIPGNIDALNSPTLVQNPVDSANLAVSSRIDTPFFSCALDVSVNSGASWSQTAIPTPKGEQAKCYAPNVAFARDGTLYLSFVTLAGAGNTPHALWVATSKDGGRTLSTPVRVHGPLTFQVRLTTDPRDAHRVYLTWLQGLSVGFLKFTGPGNPIVVSRSDDGGATWSAAVQVNAAAYTHAITPVPAVAADGTLYVLYVDTGNDVLDYEGAHNGHGGPPYQGRYTLVLARSRDEGAHWQESIVDSRVRPMSRYIVFLAPSPSLALDSSGRVYVAFTDVRLGDPDVWLWTLAPGNRAWVGPKRVNDTKLHDGTAQYLPQIAVAPDGRLDMLYYDRRADPHNIENEASFQSSFDHGRTFTPSIRLSSRPSDSRIGFGAREGLPDLGSRLALISDNRAAAGIWTDTRDGTPQTQKQDLAEEAVAIQNASGLSSGAKDALRYAVLVAGLAGLVLLGLVLARRARAHVS